MIGIKKQKVVAGEKGGEGRKIHSSSAFLERNGQITCECFISPAVHSRAVGILLHSPRIKCPVKSLFGGKFLWSAVTWSPVWLFALRDLRSYCVGVLDSVKEVGVVTGMCPEHLGILPVAIFFWSSKWAHLDERASGSSITPHQSIVIIIISYLLNERHAVVKKTLKQGWRS